jgi:hypothetical protein
VPSQKGTPLNPFHDTAKATALLAFKQKTAKPRENSFCFEGKGKGKGYTAISASEGS